MKVHIIVGPTAVGKTALSLLIAEKRAVEIISADSRQIYRYMDIGTAKVSPEVRRQVPHHFIDICTPDEYYSAGMFGKQARQTVEEIVRRGKIPLVVGGSGFYIRALVDGIFELDARDESLRRQLEQRLQNEGLSALYRELQKVDPTYAAKISANDRQRILRSLEVFYVTGKPFSAWHEQKPEPAPFEAVFWGLTAERATLYRRINERVLRMLQEGLEEEVRRLLEMGYSPQLNALNTVGYKEVIEYLDGKFSRETMIELIQRNSRRYAKRQLTWFRADSRVHWHEVADTGDLKEIAEKILARLP
jgi:tRNA dimethylallyltransferase